jgi:hypothetical protein
MKGDAKRVEDERAAEQVHGRMADIRDRRRTDREVARSHARRVRAEAETTLVAVLAALVGATGVETAAVHGGARASASWQSWHAGAVSLAETHDDERGGFGGAASSAFTPTVVTGGTIVFSHRIGPFLSGSR